MTKQYAEAAVKKGETVMTEYINTTTLLKEIDHAFHTDTIGKKDVINLIVNLPVADVTPVLHGRWRCHGDCGVTECSVCGWSIEEYVGDYAYCPNCGAKMDGGED